MPFLPKKDIDNYEHKLTTEEANNSNSQANIENNSQVNMLENIINNPGLKHITEKLFWNLDYCHLELCTLFRKKRFEINFFVRRNASKFAISIEKENPCSFFRFSFRAFFSFPL